MAISLKAESTLTDRYQTTVPETVRSALGLGKRDKVQYEIRPTGEVVLTRVVLSEEDPVLGQFLNFLAEDVRSHPERLRGVDASLVERGRALSKGVKFEMDEALLPENE